MKISAESDRKLLGVEKEEKVIKMLDNNICPFCGGALTRKEVTTSNPRCEYSHLHEEDYWCIWEVLECHCGKKFVMQCLRYDITRRGVSRERAEEMRQKWWELGTGEYITFCSLYL